MSTISVPPEVLNIVKTLEKAGFEAFIVGGCVRDSLLGKAPKDWDVTTNAKPEQIQGLFPETYCDNDYGTVGVVAEGEVDPAVKVVEITPYRIEHGYSDNRRPDAVTFSEKLEDDLKRRDFTVNAIAYSPSKSRLVDLFNGQNDLKERLIRAVGKPQERFTEDALRLLRAVRIATEHGFTIEAETERAIQASSSQLGKISKERIRDELVRIVESEQPADGIRLARKLGLLDYIVPELEAGVGVEQNQAHKYEVFEHNLRTLQHAADKGYATDIRIAALFHDIDKPAARRWSDEKKDWTFHGHEVIGARTAKKRLTELKFSKAVVEKVTSLVRWHMFFSDPEQITLSAVRRMIRNVGEQNIWDLMDLRICDRIGTGRPKEQPFRFRKYKSMVEEALRSPVSVGQLNIDGGRVMEVCELKPGPKIGFILHALLEEVLDDPERNSAEYLEKRSIELAGLSEAELKERGEAGKKRREREEEEALKKLREKYWVG